jgi:hypothetical protein
MVKSKQHKHAENEFIIVMVAIVALAALAVVGIFGDQFVGLGIGVSTYGDVGFELTEGKVSSSGTMFPVYAYLDGMKTGNFEMTFKAPKGTTLSWVPSKATSDWKGPSEATNSRPYILHVKESMLIIGTPLSSTEKVKLGDLKIEADNPSGEITIENVKIYDFNSVGVNIWKKSIGMTLSPGKGSDEDGDGVDDKDENKLCAKASIKNQNGNVHKKGTSPSDTLTGCFYGDVAGNPKNGGKVGTPDTCLSKWDALAINANFGKCEKDLLGDVAGSPKDNGKKGTPDGCLDKWDALTINSIWESVKCGD